MAESKQAAVSSGSSKIEDVINSLDAPTNPSDVATWKDCITAYDAAVYGKYAVTDAEVRLLVNPATWQHCMGLEAGTTGNSALIREKMPRDCSGRSCWTVSCSLTRAC